MLPAFLDRSPAAHARAGLAVFNSYLAAPAIHALASIIKCFLHFLTGRLLRTLAAGLAVFNSYLTAPAIHGR